MQSDIENPVSIDLIEPHLFLGNATVASDIRKLLELKINHILTVDSCPLSDSIRSNPQITYKYVQASDIPKEDLLQHFDECITWIDNAISKGNNVLVHCYYGVSRSATVVIAYVMKKYGLKFDKAYDRVKSKRTLVGPNIGFVQQLRLFHRMGFNIDKSDEKYKVYRLRLAADKIQKAKILPSNYMDLIKSDPAIQNATPEPIVFRCKRCRRVLAAKSNLLTHFVSTDTSHNSTNAQNHTSVLVNQIKEQLQLTSLNEHSQSDKSQETEKTVCTQAYFFEPITWMQNILHHTQGRLTCPKCSSKLGNFNWILSSKCPCGKQVQPAFYMMPSRIEKSNVVQNVQVTV